MVVVMAGIAVAQQGERHNDLRPQTLDDIVGQPNAKRLMRRAMRSSVEHGRVLDHVLLVGAAGTGKSTFSHAVAHDMGVNVYDLEAPISFNQLLELRLTMNDGDILKVEEIHQQAIMERRGRNTATTPEVLYSVLEDRVLPTPEGLLPFPAITVIGTTTDEGMLPDPFLDRFPLRPHLVPYSDEDLFTIVMNNAAALDLRITYDAVEVFARACRGVPRQIGNFIKNAVITVPRGELCDSSYALDVLHDCGVTEDGLTSDMQKMLTFLFTRCARVTSEGTRYQASVNTIATAIGKSRDSKAIALRVEPYLIEQGLLQVGHSGRLLTDRGVDRAVLLLDGE